jgi:hypothetical protein
MCCSIAALAGIVTFLSLVRPSVRSHARGLDEASELESWWRLDGSHVPEPHARHPAPSRRR